MAPQRPRETVTLMIAVVVTGVWTISTLAQVISPDRQVPTYANIIMGAVVGSLFGAAYARSRRNGKPNGDEEG